MTDVSFTIQFPRFITPPCQVQLKRGLNVIYGESGVGKSDLCRWLATGRRSELNTNFDISRLTGTENAMLVMQDPDDQIVAPSIFGELAFNLENLGWNSEKIGRTIRRVAQTFELDWDLDRHPSTLSGGERELLNMATSLSVSPNLLVVDDSLAFLSDVNKKKVIAILQDYCERRNAVVLWATSDPSDLDSGKQRFELRLDRLLPLEGHVRDSLPGIELAPGQIRVEISNLEFGYDRAKPLFVNQSVTVGPFRSLAVLGDNGAGKSTLGSLVVGAEVAVSGKIRVRLDSGKEATIGLLPQFPERYFGGWTFSEILRELSQEARFDESNISLLEKTLGNFQVSWNIVRERPIHDLRLSVVRVVLMIIVCLSNYDLMIVDEPMFSLGLKQRKKLLDFLSDTLVHKHLILITHSEEIAREICDTAVRIESGEIVPADLKKGTYV